MLYYTTCAYMLYNTTCFIDTVGMQPSGIPTRHFSRFWVGYLGRDTNSTFPSINILLNCALYFSVTKTMGQGRRTFAETFVANLESFYVTHTKKYMYDMLYNTTYVNKSLQNPW